MENKRYKKEQDIHLTKEEYLAQLKKYLKRLPKEDYNNAMDYFTEYFEDAGSEGETSLMQELGTPKEAAYDILDNLISERSWHSGMEDHTTYLPCNLCRSSRRFPAHCCDCCCTCWCSCNLCRASMYFCFRSCLCYYRRKTFSPGRSCHNRFSFWCKFNFWCRII